MGGQSLHVGVTTIVELDQSYLHPSIMHPETDNVMKGS
jgi:hypothetical protein